MNFEKLMRWMEKRKAEKIEREAEKLAKSLWASHRGRSALSRSIIGNRLLMEEWTRSAPVEFPGMDCSRKAWVRSADGLASFLWDACRSTRRFVALPSLAADSVWHAWLRMDSKGFEAFCEAKIGRAVEHEPKEQALVNGSSMEQGLSLCWAGCCSGEGIDPLSGTIPSLFELDRVLRMPGGYAYRFDKKGRRVAHELIDGDGRTIAGTGGWHMGLTASGLAMAGAVSAVEFEQWRVRQRKEGSSDGGGSSCGIGSSCGSSGCSSDGGCSGDGGSSCGGGCGGGCGG